jgi:hypothetical protein
MASESCYHTEPIQIIDGNHLDQRKLVTLLKEVYGTSEGKNNFRVEVRQFPDRRPNPLIWDS